MTADTVISTYFQHKDFTGLYDFHKLLRDNATNMPTELTNGNYALLPLIISPTD